MKVCSLIEKASDKRDSSSLATTSNAPQLPGLLDLSSSSVQPTSVREPGKMGPNSEDVSGSPQHNINEEQKFQTIEKCSPLKPYLVPESVAVSLLGPGVSGSAMSSTILEEALRLRVEQEKTRQELLKLEVATKNKSILEFAVEKNIPPESLSILGHEEQPDRTNFAFPQARQSVSQSHIGISRGSGQHDLLNGPFDRAPYRNATTTHHARLYEDPSNASTVDPMNFRFGSVGKISQRSPQHTISRRPCSPSKIGAIAIANLASPVTPYRPSNRTIPLHQRHYSMPVEGMSSGSKVAERQHSKTRIPHVTQGSNVLRSPVGDAVQAQMRSLQVQPSHKSTKRGQSFSQDSMSQHQQVIQFHHWISENPGETPADRIEHRRTNSTTLQSQTSTSNKRQKPLDAPIDLPPSGSPLHSRPASRTVSKTGKEI